MKIYGGPLYGYQYLTIVPGRNFQHLKQYYDINLELDAYGKVRPTEANQKEFRKNEFLIALSGTYIEYGYSRKSNVMLIMKEEDASMADYSICEIDYDKISRLREIYSRYGAPMGMDTF